ncbi:TonB-dependent receptor domain-containing protein [Mucilaginibacter gotjawali]|uniref:TonB-dependent Receptor Plug Domain protein n=2 Tax=Mucilaginibacter gotjawali TaxID=1550579 RepID=A0A0X8X590_9SPHI|nr:TonB-dependent receptor [Mucilaginibacter gotjawali]MBB3056855.1 outer membrane receptor protein involved in Fe transport [Mucilaginibacter gotjawali]BAU55935.1 TonB-dependent Receptor Plug Domain protein [Mucilaginibacter gotjawali]
MKRFYIFFAFLFSVITANAQFGVGGGGSNIVGKISGTLIDSISKKPLDYASVGLFRVGGKSPLSGSITDAKGNFRIDGVHPGNYNLVITFIGYPTKTVGPFTTTDSKPDKNTGVINVSPGAKTLKEVTVTGQANLIENHIDKIVYNAEKDLTSTGGNASDVLQKVPMVSVDLNGNVAVRGDQNVKVLINGKPSGATSASLSDVLKTIPAAQIKTIEVITSPSAKYDAEGSAGIINIITKQTNISGISGSVSGGFGTRQNNGNFNLNYNKNRFSLSVNTGGNLTWPQTSISDFNQHFQYGNTNVAQSSDGTSLVKRYGTISSVTASYQFNAFNDITSTFRYNKGGFNTNSNNTSTRTDYNHPDSSYSYLSNTLGHNSFGGFDWTMDYTHKFKKEGNNIVFSGEWSHSEIITDFTDYFTPQKLTNVKNNIDGINNEYTFQADYTLPVNKLLKVEAGAKEVIRRLSSNSQAFDPSGNDFVYDPLTSSVYDYNQNVTAGYTVLTFTLPKGYSILAGGRVENTNIHGDPQSAGETFLTPFNSDYQIYIPSLTLQKQISSTQTIKLSYSKRITRPSLQFLNPYVSQTNKLAQTVGNVALSPEVSQTIDLNYNTFIKSSLLNFSIYYRHIDGVIENIANHIVVDSLIGTLTKYQNADVNNSFGFNFFTSINPIKILTLRTNINVYTYSPTPYAQYAYYFTNTATKVQYNIFLSASVTLPKDLVAELFALENSPRYTLQGQSPSFSLLGLGVKKQFLNKKASIGINTLEPFNKYKNFNSTTTSPGITQTSHFAFPFRSVGLTFSYSFGKLKFATPSQKKGDVDEEKQGDQGIGGAGGGR